MIIIPDSQQLPEKMPKLSKQFDFYQWKLTKI